MRAPVSRASHPRAAALAHPGSCSRSACAGHASWGCAGSSRQHLQMPPGRRPRTGTQGRAAMPRRGRRGAHRGWARPRRRRSGSGAAAAARSARRTGRRPCGSCATATATAAGMTAPAPPALGARNCQEGATGLEAPLNDGHTSPMRRQAQGVTAAGARAICFLTLRASAQAELRIDILEHPRRTRPGLLPGPARTWLLPRW